MFKLSTYRLRDKMINHLKLLLPLLLAVSVACSTSNKTSSYGSDNNRTIVIAKNLPRYIDKLSRLTVRGSGDNLQVINTSANTITGTSEPLFVLDGIQMGRSLSQLMRLLDENQALSVEYLTTRRATIRYGEEGKNGVIILNRQQGG